jgi:glycine/D-amino acid oxidase-like deaminating enzyme/nitrite reductase/ring-hydroxylating ferredoxin subunit
MAVRRLTRGDAVAAELARNLSFWLETTEDTSYPQLTGAVAVDVAVIGGGITGLMTAWLLKEAGASVAVVEAFRIASSVTGFTTAKVTSQHGLLYAQLRKSLGVDKARLYGEANEAAKELIAEVVSARSIDCDFRRVDAFVYTTKDDEADSVRGEAEMARELGLPAELVEGEIGLPFKVVAAVRFANQAQFHPRAFLLPLARAIDGDGSHVLERTRVAEVEDGDPCVVRTEHGALRARAVVMATHIPFQMKGEYFAKAFAKRGYVVAGVAKPETVVPRGIYITAGSPTRSLRTAFFGEGTVVMVGGEGHKTGAENFTDARYERLESWARSELQLSDLRWRWSTQDYASADGVPFVGTLGDSEHVYVATGFGGWGMTNGTVAAMLIRDTILGGENPWSDVFDSTRNLSVLKSVGTVVKENAAALKDLVMTPFRDDDVDLAALTPGEGAVTSIAGEKIAVSRADAGGLVAVSAVCTHMGCAVEWNHAEQTWDCPCHGSRFRPDGTVIQGPAVTPLEERPLH